MKILTLNCQRGYRKEKLAEYLSRQLQQGKYDYILLQELDEETVKIFNNTQYSITALDADMVSSSSVGIAWKEDSNVENIFRIPFEKEVTPLHTYSFGVVALQDGDKIIASIHMPAYFLNFHNRFKYLIKTFNFLDEHVPGKQTIIGGDWNSIMPFERKYLEQAVSKQYKLYAPTEFTYDPSLIEPGLFWNEVCRTVTKVVCPTFILDYFISNFPLESTPIVLNNIVSDHYPVEIDI
ncbi:MAG: hypothetical protein Q8O98_00895 [bacterium]|nr:hypothetical protein [bacterium]